MYGAASVAVLGDSISVGVGSDGSSSSAGSDVTYRAQGWVGQLRSLFAQSYGDPGEGFIGGNQADYGALTAIRALTMPFGPGAPTT